jgi:hypothetical protein
MKAQDKEHNEIANKVANKIHSFKNGITSTSSN